MEGSDEHKPPVEDGSEAELIAKLQQEVADMRLKLAVEKKQRDGIRDGVTALKAQLEKAIKDGSPQQDIAAIRKNLGKEERRRRDANMAVHAGSAPTLLVPIGCGTDLWGEPTQNSSAFLIEFFLACKTVESLKTLADMARSLSDKCHGDKKGRQEFLGHVTGSINMWLGVNLTIVEASLVMRTAEAITRILDYVNFNGKVTWNQSHLNQMNSLLQHFFDGENARAFMELVGAVFPEIMPVMLELIATNPTLQRTPMRAKSAKSFGASGGGAKKSATFDERCFMAEGGSCAAGDGACELEEAEAKPFMAGGGACAAGDGACAAMKASKPKGKQGGKSGKTVNRFVVLDQPGVCPKAVDGLFSLNDPLFAHTFSFYKDVAKAEHAQLATPGSEILTGAMLKQANELAHKAYLARQVKPVPAMGQKKMRE